MRGLMLFWCVGLALAALAIEPPVNVLLNGDFEKGMAGWAGSANVPGGAVAVDGVCYQGKSALLLSVPAKGNANAGSDLAAVHGGHDYLFTLRYRSEGFSRKGGYDGVSASYQLTFVDADNKQVGSVGVGLPYDPQPKWALSLRLFSVPDGATGVRFSIGVGVGDGAPASKLWIDQLQLRQWDGVVKPGGRTWTFHADQYFATADFRRVADDEAASGFSVIANTRFQKNPGYMVGGLYFGQSGKGLPSGAYRVLFRMRVKELPNPPVAVASIDVNPQFGGGGNARTVMSDEFKQAGVYQDIPLRFVVSPESGYVDFRAYWNGKVTTWADTFTIVEEETYTDEQINALFK